MGIILEDQKTQEYERNLSEDTYRLRQIKNLLVACLICLIIITINFLIVDSFLFDTLGAIANLR